MNILLSIKPEWARLIYEGKKTIDDFVQQGCVPFENLKAYQGDSDRVVGWIVKNPTKLDIPMDLADFGIKRPPQSWRYVE